MIKSDELKSFRQGHRARLRQKFLDDQLTDYEILELLLTYAIPRCDVRTLARRLYEKYENIDNLLTTPIEYLMKNEGVKENTAVLFKVINKITQLKYKQKLIDSPVFNKPDVLEHYCKSLIGGNVIEEFHILYLDGNYRLIKDEKHSVGTVDWVAIYIREIVKHALDLNARNIIMVHNHPTPERGFSEDDVKITEELRMALNSLKIELYDHLVVNGDEIMSMKQKHLLNLI